MLQVAEVAKMKWREVGRSLGFMLRDLDECEETGSKSLQWRLFGLLVKWKGNSEQPTARALVSAFEQAGVGGDIIKEVQYKLY